MMVAVMTPPMMVMAVVAMMAPVMVVVVTMMVVMSVRHFGRHGRRHQQRSAEDDRRENLQHSYSPGSTWGRPAPGRLRAVRAQLLGASAGFSIGFFIM